MCVIARTTPWKEEVEPRLERRPDEVTKQSPKVLILGCGDCFAALAMTNLLT
jgi:carbonic anhydrase